MKSIEESRREWNKLVERMQETWMEEHTWCVCEKCGLFYNKQAGHECLGEE